VPFNRPSNAELLVAVGETLDAQSADPRSATPYQQRIVQNVLKILEREALQGPALLEDELRRLRAFLDSTAPLEDLNRELCRRIASGEEDARFHALWEILYQSACGKLAVDNPRFAAYRRALTQSRQRNGAA
jgi:Domain of unknown function (DUF6285)